MKQLLVLGAGRSSSSLIRYLLVHASVNTWTVTVADSSLAFALEKVQGSPHGRAVAFNVNDAVQRAALIQSHDLVISLMPPPLHFPVAQTCLQYSRHLLTASYVSPEIASLDHEAKSKGVLILMETGLDPGIDHMSAIKELEEIREKGGKLVAFKSYTGGLIAPESDNNPWHYKITWNPRNVVLAGKGTSTYLEDGKVKEVDYQDLFTTTETIDVKGYGEFEGYPNRDSLKYLETYNLQGLTNFLRGTLRRPGYCSAWNMLVRSGFTKDTITIPYSDKLSYRDITAYLLKDVKGKTLEEKLLQFGNREDLERVTWLGCLDDAQPGIANAMPADILQKLMEEKWKLMPGDKDMIVMQHQFEYELNGKRKKLTSSLVVKGDDEKETAMAKTVGLPLAIAVKLLLQGKISLQGVQIPVHAEIYYPALKELEDLGIKFVNEEVDL